MIEWREPLYLDQNMGDGEHLERAKRKAEEGTGSIFPAFGVFLAQNPDNLLEIISLNELLQPGYQARHFRCVGLAANREGAQELVRLILEEVLQETGALRVREFLYPEEETDKGDG